MNINARISSELQNSKTDLNICVSEYGGDEFALTVNDITINGFDSRAEAFECISLLSGCDLSVLNEAKRLIAGLEAKEVGEGDVFESTVKNIRKKDLDFIKNRGLELTEINGRSGYKLTLLEMKDVLCNLDTLDNVALLLMLSTAIEQGSSVVYIYDSLELSFDNDLGDLSYIGEQCLENTQCPCCGDSTRFNSSFIQNSDWHSNGLDKVGGSSFMEKSVTECLSCNYKNQLKAFRVL